MKQPDRDRALRALEKVHERLERLNEQYYAQLEKAGAIPTLEEIEAMDGVGFTQFRKTSGFVRFGGEAGATGTGDFSKLLTFCQVRARGPRRLPTAHRQRASNIEPGSRIGFSISLGLRVCTPRYGAAAEVRVLSRT